MFAVIVCPPLLHTLNGHEHVDTWTQQPCVMVECLIPKPSASICSCSGLISSGFRLSTRFLNQAAGICSHSATSALVWSYTDAGWWGLAHSRRSTSSQRCWMEPRPNFSRTETGKTVFFYGRLCAWSRCHVKTGNRVKSTCCLNIIVLHQDFF